MASDGIPARIAGNATAANQAPKSNVGQVAGGKPLPQGGNITDLNGSWGRSATTATASNETTATAASATTATAANDRAHLQAVLAQLNKYLNDSGRPNQFRIDPASRDRTIQEINPATGEVIGEFAASEFPALARSLGVSGVLVDSRA